MHFVGRFKSKVVLISIFPAMKCCRALLFPWVFTLMGHTMSQLGLFIPSQLHAKMENGPLFKVSKYI